MDPDDHRVAPLDAHERRDRQAPPELLAAFQSLTSPSTLADMATSYLDIKAQNTVFEDVLAMTRGRQVSMTGAGEPLAVAVTDAPPNLFRLWDDCAGVSE